MQCGCWPEGERDQHLGRSQEGAGPCGGRAYGVDVRSSVCWCSSPSA